MGKVRLRAGRYETVGEEPAKATPAVSIETVERPATKHTLDPVAQARKDGRSFEAQLKGLPEADKAIWRLRHPDQDGCGFTGEYHLPGGDTLKMERGFVQTKQKDVRDALIRAGFQLYGTEIV